MLPERQLKEWRAIIAFLYRINRENTNRRHRRDLHLSMRLAPVCTLTIN